MICLYFIAFNHFQFIVTYVSARIAYLHQNVQNRESSCHFSSVRLTFIMCDACSATIKAVDAAVNSRQWLKAVQILEVLPNRPEVQKYYKKIAQHHAIVGEYEVRLRSVFFLV